MLIITGRVNGGRVELLDEALPEGITVTVLAPEEGETFAATPDEEARLLAAITEGERGEAVDAAVLLKQISK